MFWLKKCPRCGGDLYQAMDSAGVYVQCLQCARPVALAATQVPKRAAPKLARVA